MILEEIKRIVKDMDIEFVFGNLYETNWSLDEVSRNTQADWFFVYITPFEVDDSIQVNAIHSTFPLQFFVVNKVNNPTLAYTSELVQPIVDVARDKARNFIHRLNQSSLIDKQTPGITEVKIRSEYAWQDLHLFGVSAECTVPVFEGKTGCV